MKEHALATEESRKLPFDQLCNLLNADEDTQTQGWSLMLRVLRAVNVTPEQERFFFAAALCTSIRRAAISDVISDQIWAAASRSTMKSRGATDCRYPNCCASARYGA